MKILTAHYNNQQEVNSTLKWTSCFHGESLDHRGDTSVNFLKENSKNVYKIIYTPSEFTVQINEEIIQKDDLDDFFEKMTWESVVIDSTTVGFVELLLIAKYAISKCPTFEILYLQPEHYKKKDSSTILRSREFDITSETPGYQAIPGFSTLLQNDDSNHFVFIAGYEPIRLDRAFEDYQMITSENCDIVFGLPAYKPGWENNAFANNISVLTNRRIVGEVKYCGALNPLAVYSLLHEIRKSLDHNTNLVISPIGPKPLGIGAALFIATRSGVSVLYDHPINKEARTEKIAKWIFYKIINE
jgi:hypothetical protein